MHITPDWAKLAEGPPPKSRFIEAYEAQRQENPELPALSWMPVGLEDISPHLRRAVIVGEDSRFYRHGGVDVEAFKEAMAFNIEHRRLAYGASTITQQTVKNLFLSASRDPLRKWHEFLLALNMEHHLSKERILELYLNVAEFGTGIYGAEAAAQRYWGRRAKNLNAGRAAELAASLPSPRIHNPQTRSKRFYQNKRKIMYWMARNQHATQTRTTR